MDTSSPSLRPADDERLPELIAGMVAASEALSAISAFLWLRGSGRRAAPVVERALSEVLEVLGLTAVIAELGPPDVLALSEMIRARITLASELSREPLREPEWARTAPEVINAARFGTTDLATIVYDQVRPRLTGLSERLASEDASFLQVGVDAAGLTIALCRTAPRLRGEGIDISEAAVASARENVRLAGLGARVQLRCQNATELDDRDAYDLVWLPSDHVAPHALPDVLRRVFAATRLGGWVILNVHGGADELRVVARALAYGAPRGNDAVANRGRVSPRRGRLE